MSKSNTTADKPTSAQRTTRQTAAQINSVPTTTSQATPGVILDGEKLT